MIKLTLAATALAMGVTGGPHCIAMCGAACAGIGRAVAPRSARALGIFQFGRLVGYSSLGALAAATIQGLGWLTIQSAALRPAWAMVHIAAVVFGLLMLIQARQPIWLENGARQIWAQIRSATQAIGLIAPLGLGMAWALLPCGLLYSALMVAALAGDVLDGAVFMALFAIGSGISLWLAPWLLLRLGSHQRGTWGIRLAGLALLVTSAWGLWMGLAHGQAPWCVASTPH